MSHICCSNEGEVHINKTKATVKLDCMYAIVKCVNTNEAMNRIRSHEFLDGNNYLYSELKINEAWLDICRIVQEVDIELAQKLKKPKPKQESKIPVKKFTPTENILNLDEIPPKLDEVPVKLLDESAPSKPNKPEITREDILKLVNDELSEHLKNIHTTLMTKIIENIDKKMQII